MHSVSQAAKPTSNPTEPGRKFRSALAYLGIFIVSAGDTVRYSIGFPAWGALGVALSVVALVLFFKDNPMRTLRRIPKTLVALLGFMLLSTAWSNYPGFTLVGYAGTLIATFFALFLVANYSWRQLLVKFANVFRFIMVASIIFELYAAVIVRGPIAPIFKNYKGPVPPSGAYYWTQGWLLKGARIQGILGNANLLAYIAMLGFILFAVQYALKAPNRKLSAASMLLSAGCLALTRSAGVGFAMTGAIAVVLVALISEGQDRETRHRYYRVALTGFGIAAFFVMVYRAQLFTLIGKSPDMTGRSEIWKAVLGLIAQRPIQGWGWISYWMPGVKPYEGLFVRDNVTYYEAHNAYLDVWLQLGIFGLLLFLAVIGTTFVKLWRLAVRHTSPLYLWPIFVFVALLLQNLTESRLIIELGWVFLFVFATKANEPAETLEPLGAETKKLRFRIRGLAKLNAKPEQPQS